MREIQPDKTAIDWPEYSSSIGIIVVKNGKLPDEVYTRIFREFGDSITRSLEDLDEDATAEEILAQLFGPDPDPSSDDPPRETDTITADDVGELLPF